MLVADGPPACGCAATRGIGPGAGAEEEGEPVGVAISDEVCVPDSALAPAAATGRLPLTFGVPVIGACSDPVVS